MKAKSLKIQSGGKPYPAYLATLETEKRVPAIVLLHSFHGLEHGYKVIIDKLAQERLRGYCA